MRNAWDRSRAIFPGASVLSGRKRICAESDFILGLAAVHGTYASGQMKFDALIFTWTWNISQILVLGMLLGRAMPKEKKIQRTYLTGISKKNLAFATCIRLYAFENFTFIDTDIKGIEYERAWGENVNTCLIFECIRMRTEGIASALVVYVCRCIERTKWVSPL